MHHNPSCTHCCTLLLLLLLLLHKQEEMGEAEPVHASSSATSRAAYNDSPCTVASLRSSPVAGRRPSLLVSEMLPLSTHTTMTATTATAAAAAIAAAAAAASADSTLVASSRMSISGNWSMLGGFGVTEGGVSGSNGHGNGNGSSGLSAPQLRSDSMSTSPLYQTIEDMDW
jgi:hypothetical protein